MGPDRWTRWCVAGAVGILLLAACGSGDDNGEAAEPADEAAEPADDAAEAAEGADECEASTEIVAVGTEFAFDPDEWCIPAGEETTIEFENAGDDAHEWLILSVEIRSEDEVDAEFEDLLLFAVNPIAEGDSVTAMFTVDEPGTYQVVCVLPGHFDAGMEGTLLVTDDGGG